MNRSASAFSLLSPAIQEQLYRMQWRSLHDIQEDAIHAVFGGDSHLLITAATAGGKTEAAFLPVLSKLSEQTHGKVFALYVSPLKALINDQFQRLDILCENADIPVIKWHGDVSSSKKAQVFGVGSSVMLITPESIESIMINRSERLKELFSNLQYITIDEVHAFTGTDRGEHLRSLLYRVSSFSDVRVRFIGLSATVGDPKVTADWMCLGDKNISFIKGSGERDIQYLIKGYEDKIGTENDDDVKDTGMTADIIKYFYRKSSLIFINRKSRIEQIADSIERSLEASGKLNTIFVHHGSLSKQLREDTEDEMRKGIDNTVICSSTLEMGIDMGNIQIVGQVGCPFSVNSLVQRLGRSGRKEGQPSVMVMFIEEHNGDKIEDRLYPELVTSVAMSELMRQKWTEPPIISDINYSVVIQQTLSIIKQKGGVTAKEAYDTLAVKGSFKGLASEDYVLLLKEMGSKDLIEQHKNLLILGLLGEKITKSIDFYAVFTTPDEYKVVHDGQHIGNIQEKMDAVANPYLILGGRRWQVDFVDDEAKIIYVKPSKGGRPASYNGGGECLHHEIVHSAMLDVYNSDTRYSYLDRKSSEMLSTARNTAAGIGIRKNMMIQEGEDVFWFLFGGFQVSNTLALIGSSLNHFKIDNCCFYLRFGNTTAKEVSAFYKSLIGQQINFIDLLLEKDPICIGKYDKFVPHILLAKSYASKYLTDDYKCYLNMLRSDI